MGGRIWHYQGDVFVHRRLVQMVAASGRFEVAALPEPAQESAGAPRSASAASQEGGKAKGQESLREANLAMELDAVLASQLDYQRSLYEAKLRSLGKQHQEAKVDMQAKVETAQTRQIKLAAQLAEAQNEQKRLDGKLAKARQSMSKASEELEFAKEVNRSLLTNRAEMKKKGSAASASSSGQAASTASPVEDDPLVLRLRKRVAELMEAVTDDTTK